MGGGQQTPPQCCQVCFYYAKGGVLKEGRESNGRVTVEVARGLVGRGFMVDYAEADMGDGKQGKGKGRGMFLRAVVSRGTGIGTVEGLVEAVVELGGRVWDDRVGGGGGGGGGS